ncbi:hypothetical protein EX30DRAFT_221659, partial [Ascodesmis nigricans]
PQLTTAIPISTSQSYCLLLHHPPLYLTHYKQQHNVSPLPSHAQPHHHHPLPSLPPPIHLLSWYDPLHLPRPQPRSPWILSSRLCTRRITSAAVWPEPRIPTQPTPGLFQYPPSASSAECDFSVSPGAVSRCWISILGTVAISRSSGAGSTISGCGVSRPRSASPAASSGDPGDGHGADVSVGVWSTTGGGGRGRSDAAESGGGEWD